MKNPFYIASVLLLLSSVEISARKIVSVLHRNNNKQGGAEELVRSAVNDADHLDGLYQGWGIHYVEVFVGCPNPQKQTLIVDTGSDSMGFPCSPDCDPDSCGDAYHLNPFYQYSNSTCFTTIPCDDCQQGYSQCGSSTSTCSLGASYVEGSSWSGYEVEDAMSIGSSDEEQYSVRFACQTSLTGLFRTQLADGIVGMNKGSDSLWKQLDLDENKFSLCYELQEDATEAGGVMVLGGHVPSLHDIPIVYAQDVRPTSRQFTVNIREVYLRVGGGTSVIPHNDTTNGTTSVKLASAGLLETQSSATPIVDSGTTCTYLSSSLRDPIEQAWKEVTDEPFDIDGISLSEIDKYPTILFQLEGATLQDNPNAPGITPDHPDDIWVAFPPAHYRRCLYFQGGSTVLGNNVMAGHNVVFDIDNARIGFAESGCDISNLDSTTLAPSAPSAAPTPSTTSQPTSSSAAQSSSSSTSSLALIATVLMIW